MTYEHLKYLQDLTFGRQSCLQRVVNIGDPYHKSLLNQIQKFTKASHEHQSSFRKLSQKYQFFPTIQSLTLNTWTFE